MFNPAVAKLLPYFKPTAKTTTKESEANIHVDEIIGSVAFLYEKLRNIVDFKEEKLLRKEAVNRILKRTLFMEDIKKLIPVDLEKEIAESLIKELIQARYLPNNTIPKKKVVEIDKVIDKYILLIQQVNKGKYKQRKDKIVRWIISLAACEIEERLVPDEQEKALAGAMYEIMKERLVISDKYISLKDRDLQLYVAIHRTLLKYDQPLLSYLLLKLYYPGWLKADGEAVGLMARDIEVWQQCLDEQIRHPAREKFTNFCRRQAILFSILRDTLVANEDNLAQLVKNPKNLADEVKKVSLKKHKEVKRKIAKSSFHAIIYIFVTKMALALAIEIPFDLYVLHHINYYPIIINIAFHPLLMFIITMSVTFPVKKNTQKIVEGVEQIVYEEKSKEVRLAIRTPKKHRSFSSFFFQLIYALTYVISFGVLIYALWYLKFSILGGVLFLVFLSLVSFFAMRIRLTTKELMVIERKGNIVATLFDFFTLPIVRVGRKLSEEFSRLNIFLFFLDYFIEAPLKTLLRFLEDWFNYMKDRKEETINT